MSDSTAELELTRAARAAKASLEREADARRGRYAELADVPARAPRRTAPAPTPPGQPCAWPGFLAAVADVAGDDAALKVALTFGGRDLYLPTPAWLREQPEHVLGGVLPDGAFAELVRRHGGMNAYVPMARRALAQRLALRGESTAVIASLLGVSRKCARRYTRGFRGRPTDVAR